MVEEPITVVGEPTWNLKEPTPGSKAHACVLCKTGVWISTDSQNMIENGAQVMCRPCALKNMSESDKVKIIPGAERTLSEYFGRHITKQELEEYVKQMRKAG